MKRTSSLLLMIVFGLSLSACGASRSSSLALNATAIATPSLKGDFNETLEQAHLAWGKRLEEKSLRQAITLYERAAKLPTPQLSKMERAQQLATIYVRLSRAHYFLADSHLFLSLDEKSRDKPMMRMYERGLTAAEKALALSAPAFASQVAKDKSSWKTHVNKAPREAIPALYWYGANLGKWAMLEGITTIMSRQEDIKATMAMIERVQPEFFHGAPHRYFGVYYTKVPVGGGEPRLSEKSFEQSIDLAPNYFATRVLYASHLATLKQDQKLFEKQLKHVINTNASVVPSIAPENALEQRKAKRLLARTTTLFYQLTQ